MMPRLSALYCYPVKSCRGVALSEAALDQRGIIHDREMLVVDAGSRQMTQRATPKIALIERLPADMHPVGSARPVEIGFPDAFPLLLISENRCEGSGDRSCSHGTPLPCQPLPRTGVRQRSAVATFRGNTPAQVIFSHAFSAEPLDDLNRRLDLPAPLAMNRFRPNLVVTDCAEPYAGKEFRIGGVRMFAGGPCGRHVVHAGPGGRLRLGDALVPET